MTQKKTKRFTKLPPKKFYAGIFAIIICVAMTVFFVSKHDKNRSLLEFRGTDFTKMNVSLKTLSGTQELLRTGDNFTLAANENIKTAPPYILSASLQKDSGQIHTFDLIASSSPPEFIVRINGYDADNTVTFKIDKKTIHKDVPLDWSGKIELKTPLDLSRTSKACIEISNESFCHLIPKGEKA